MGYGLVFIFCASTHSQYFFFVEMFRAFFAEKVDIERDCLSVHAYAVYHSVYDYLFVQLTISPQGFESQIEFDLIKCTSDPQYSKFSLLVSICCSTVPFILINL